MPYEKVDPAAWWRGAEPMPPKPDEPGLQCRHVRLLPGLTNDPVPDDAVRLCVRREPASGQVRPAPSPLEVSVGDRVRLPPLGTVPAAMVVTGLDDAVRVGDRVHRGHDLPRRVVSLGPEWARFESRAGDVGPCLARVRDIGPPGSGKPWNLLPREPAPERGMGAAGHDATTGPVVPGDANVRVAVFAPDGSALEPAPAAPDADTAGILAAGHAGLARIAERAEAERGHGPPGPGTRNPPPIAVARVDAAHDVLRARAVGPVSWNAVCDALRAADVADPRRAALERVARAAQRARTATIGGMAPAYVEMCRALDDLAALDGEGGA